MLRPYVYIEIIEGDNIYSNSFFRPISFETEETREGISVTLSFKTNKKILKIGDKILVEYGYKNISKSIQNIPVLVVTDVQMTSDFVMECVAIDEFSYYSKITSFIPQIESNKFETKYLLDTFGVSIGQETLSEDKINSLPNINFKDLLGYIQLRIYNQFYYHENITDSELIKFKDGLLFSLLDKDLKTTTVGKFSVAAGVSIAEVLKLIKDSFLIDVYQENKSYYTDTENKSMKPVTVEVVGSVPEPKEYVIITDNINIINDNLKFLNPSENRKLYINEYIDIVEKDGKKTKVSDLWYGYYDNDGNATISNKLPSRINFIQANRYRISNANSIPKTQRKDEMMKKLISKDYKGYDGSIDTFQYACSLNDIVNLTFNNGENLLRREPTINIEHEESDKIEFRTSSFRYQDYGNYRENGLFGIKSISRSYDSSGLFMTINMRQKLTI